MPKGRRRGGTDHKATAFEGACMPATTLITVDATDCLYQVCMACQKRSCYLSYASSCTCVMLHEASEAAKPGQRVVQAWKHARKATKRTLSVQQRLHDTNAATHYRSQYEDDDLHEVRGAQDNKAMKTHQIVAHIQCHTPHVIYCHAIKIPSMQTVSLAECSWSSAFCLQNNLCSNLCMVICPWQHGKRRNMCKS